MHTTHFPSPWVDSSAGRVWSWREAFTWFATYYPEEVAGLEAESSLDMQFRAADAIVRVAAAYADAEAGIRERMTAALAALHEVA